ncbi:long-chain acyl-CoA synthetase [Stella humosa]|uniref:Long-chain acyl-CoA synthetase n=1 Tax=Stella humosa TaxID=94 RepID=A0A3N1MAM8_9PROT|nr:class I adenylate-forming enzyme family protein [Stella humosa]ROQ00115.1 long-chain acyl-CoA synthetase [Stella humosa]BBK30651.1 long-chain-fatty-acid--CoA ligase [Stella humosa]
MANYLEGILDHAARRPRAPALILPDRTIDFAGLARSMAGVSIGLAAHGLPPGAVVAIATRSPAATFRAILGTILGGHVAMPLDLKAGPAALFEIAARTGASAALVEGQGGTLAGRPAIDLDSLPASGDAEACRHPGGAHLAQVTITSGTTGPSKAAPATHAQMLERTRSLEGLLALGPDDRFLPVIDLSFGLSRHAAIRMLDVGGAVVLHPLPGSAADLMALLRDQRVTYMAITPGHAHVMLEAVEALGPGDGPALPGVRVLSISGAHVPADMRAEIRRRLTPGLHVSYGSNETGHVAHAGPAELDRAPDTVGRPLPGIAVEVVDDRGRPLPAGTIGEIRVRSRQISQAYLGDAAATARGFRADGFHMGDTGHFDAGGHLFLTGRVDDRINVGGQKVYPFEVEAVLRSHPAVADAVVFGMPAPRYSEIVVAVVVLRGDVAVADLHAYCRGRLPRAKVPRRIFKFAELPRNETGKVMVRALRDRLALPGG